MGQLRKIDMASEGEVTVKIFWDKEWGEYIVKPYVKGTARPAANYHTDNKQDAIDCMHRMGKHYLRCVRKGLV